MASNSGDADTTALKEKVVKMIKNTPINTNMFDSEIISTIEAADNRYRWYLCTQTSPAGWTCERKRAYEILDAAGRMDKSTTMIPVYKFLPSVVDTLIVRHEVRSMTHVDIIK